MLVITHRGDRQGAHHLREALRRDERQATGYGILIEGWLTKRPDTPAMSLAPNHGGPRCSTWVAS